MFTKPELVLLAMVLQGELDLITFIKARVPGLEPTEQMLEIMTLKKKVLELSQLPEPKETEVKQ